MPQRIGFAGLGLMGSRMARQFLAKGFPLAVWNRSPERTEPLAAEGASVARSPRELAETSDVVVTCVADPNAVARIVFADDGVRPAARPGFRYVETSTISPGLMRRIAEVLEGRGAEVLEAPVTGSRTGAEKGTLLLMVGGKKEILDELMPVLMAMGSKAIHCGPIGHGSVVKLVGNTLISYMLEGFCEGLVVARKAGVDPDRLLEVVMASGFSSPYYPFKAAAIAKGDYEQHFSVDLLVKDQGLMLDEAASHKAPMPGLAALREVFQAARAQGFGQEDIAAVYKVIARNAGL
ncbi:MAG TPA: NAD(P)-dependent oxidoreductase [Vicinamibacteria bacterium]|nr:NAD(P)-dependent oxidoreductase [Vicinamibacteria bacterium]